MKLLLLACLAQLAHGRRCFTCQNEPSMFDCTLNGELERCQVNQRSCETVVRRHNGGEIVTKQCKQTKACRENARNQMTSFIEGLPMCNRGGRKSVCTCCCRGNRCNLNSDPCYGPGVSCPARARIQNGVRTCTQGNRQGSVCRFRCTSPRHFVQPLEGRVVRCLDTGRWSHSQPCCARPCPPYLRNDILFLVQSRDLQSWRAFQRRMATLFGQFHVGNGSANVAVARFGSEVFPQRIAFSDVIQDSDQLIEAVENIEFSQGEGGVMTGAALSSALEFFAPGNGGSPDAPDVVVVQADDVSVDDVTLPARALRRAGIETYAIARSQTFDEEYLRQLRTVAGSGSRLFFQENLPDVGFLEELTIALCDDPCGDVTN